MNQPIDREALDGLMDAGRSAVAFNSPMLAGRAATIVESIGKQQYDAPFPSVVDFGCGRGQLLHEVIEGFPNARGLGLDTDTYSVTLANDRALSSGLVARLDYQVADVATWQGGCDVAICIGSSHTFGGSEETFAALASKNPRAAILGIAMWDVEPTQWCVEQFGELAPGIESLTDQARQAGWTVDASSASTLEEWDGFEERWIAGVRALGTEVAIGFADERLEAYQRYRGVLGFGWLTLVR